MTYSDTSMERTVLATNSRHVVNNAFGAILSYRRPQQSTRETNRPYVELLRLQRYMMGLWGSVDDDKGAIISGLHQSLDYFCMT